VGECAQKGLTPARQGVDLSREFVSKTAKEDAQEVEYSLIACVEIKEAENEGLVRIRVLLLYGLMKDQNLVAKQQHGKLIRNFLMQF